jgi:hypothetical protein
VGALKLSVLSREYVLVPVSVVVGGSVVDPTGATVQMAFLAGTASPGASDWQAADWETNSTTDPATYSARCLVGPGGEIELAPDDYTVWVKVDFGPEIPVLRAVGTLTVL